MQLISPLFSRTAPMLACALALGAALYAWPAAAGEFVPHRAVYALSKGQSRAGQAVTAVSGTMMVEVDEACDGWSLSQRIKVTVTDNLGEDVDSDNRYASFESKDGTTLRFQAADWQNGNMVEETAGTVERPAPDKPGTAEFTKPEPNSFELPANTLFPAAFNLELIKLIAKGEGYMAMTGFDGGNVEGAYTITVFIGKERDSELKTLNGDEGAPADKSLLGGKVRNVRVAYFPIASKSPEPELEYEMELQPNGVSPVIRLDYQKYQVLGRLSELKPLKRPSCEK